MRPLVRLLLAGGALGVSAGAVLAQGGPSPAMAKWREQHKYAFQLRNTVISGFQECERSSASRIKPEQAKKVLTLLTPLQKLDNLTEDKAKASIQQMQRILDTKQLTYVDRGLRAADAARAGGGGAPGGPGGAPGGAPGGGGPGGAPGGGGPGGAPGGGRPRFDPSKIRNFNPFKPNPESPVYATQKERNEKLFAFLTARAAGKEAKLDIKPMGPRGGAPGAPAGGAGSTGGAPAAKKK